MFLANERGKVGGEGGGGRGRETVEKSEGIGVVVEEQAGETDRHKEEKPADEDDGFRHVGGGGVNGRCAARHRR